MNSIFFWLVTFETSSFNLFRQALKICHHLMLKIPLGIQANDATSENRKEKSLMLAMKPNFQEVQI